MEPELQARPRAVLLTRPAGEADPLAGLLRGRGLDVVAVQTVALEPVAPGGALDAAVEDLAGFDWVLATSAAAVAALADAAERLGRSLPAGPPPRWGAVGPATAAALEAAGLPVALVPARARGVELAAALAGAASATGCRVLLPRADAADPGLPAALRAAGATAEEVVAYHTVEGPPASRAPLAAALARSDLAVVVAASGSAVRGLLRLVDDPLVRDRLDRLALVTIGPSTSGVAREAGLAVAEEAAEPTPVALAEAVVRAVAATAATSLAGTPATPTPASPAPAPTAPAFPEAPA